MQITTPPSIETRQSWTVATAALVTLMMSFGSAWIISVALKDVAAEAGGARTVPAIAAALVWLCLGFGGILMGRIADRIGTRPVVAFGGVSIGIGLAISTLGPSWPLWIGHAIFIGFFGLGSINAPLYIYISHWFDRRRGSALALISSGSYLAGALWPPLFERMIEHFGWRHTMLAWMAVELLVIVPLALIVFKAAPATAPETVKATGAKPTVLGMRPNTAYALLCFAPILCCIPMAMPQQHLVAFCSDLGYSRTFGAITLSVLLGTAFLSRQFWGVISDRIGGLLTIFIGATWQAVAMSGLLLTQSEIGLITVSAAFGLGFSGIIPAYVLAVRDLFPASEAYWRIPVMLLFTAVGMAIGGWLAGALYDHFGYYAPAFLTGVIANVLNVLLIGFLVLRQHRWRGSKPAFA
ncbi:MAG: MFS transporter [Xanthobacteraceae bacterium]|uniref:MFS transporter n=1 Tax=Pseudolabrys sp. TaxID=1960880 RepID=UPI003D12632C